MTSVDVRHVHVQMGETQARLFVNPAAVIAPFDDAAILIHPDVDARVSAAKLGDNLKPLISRLAHMFIAC